MSTFIKSLKRLYKENNITAEQLDTMKENGKITDAEYSYITETDE